MGFEGRKTVLLKFEDVAFQGLEIRTRMVSIEKILEISDIKDHIQGEGLKSGLRQFYAEFINVLVDWNLTNDGNPVPHSVDALMDQDADLSLKIAMTWFDAMTSVVDGLGKGSTSGTPFPEVSIPMEIPSPNLTNSPTQN